MNHRCFYLLKSITKYAGLTHFRNERVKPFERRIKVRVAGQHDNQTFIQHQLL